VQSTGPPDGHELRFDAVELRQRAHADESSLAGGGQWVPAPGSAKP